MYLKKIFQLVIKSELLKNTVVLISGTVLAQLIPILIRPVISHLFSSQIIGVYAVYASIFGILCVIASLRFELAIVLPKKDKTAANLLFLTFLSNTVFTVILVIILVLAGDNISKLLNIPDSLRYYLYLVPAGTFLYTIYQSINFWLIRKKQFLPLSFNKFFRRGTEGLMQVGFGFSKYSYGLMIGDLAGHLSNVISGFYQAAKYGLSFKYLSYNKLRYVFKKYIDYPKYNLIPGLMSAISFMLPVLIVNKFYSAEYTGFFDQSRLLLSIPLALIAGSLASVLLQRLSEKSMKNEGLLSDLLPILIILLTIAFFEILIIELFGVGIFKLIFGKQWGYSGEISQILVWSYAFNFIVSSFSSVFLSLNKIKMLSVWQFIYFISISSLVLFKDRNFIDFIKIYVYIEIICYLLYSLLLVKIIHSYEQKRKISFHLN
jgi:O-antigen/teichoic acid export membrane protein